MVQRHGDWQGNCKTSWKIVNRINWDRKGYNDLVYNDLVMWAGKRRGVLRLVEEMKVVSGKRKEERPRKTWKDIVKRDLELLGVDENVALDQEDGENHRKSDP